VFHKPGDTITDNSSPNQVKLPFGMDLTNLGSSYTPALPNTLNTYDTDRRIINDGDNVLFQYYDTGVAVHMKQYESNYPYTPCLFEINKNSNSIWIGTTTLNKGYVRIGGEYLYLYAKDFFHMYLDGQDKYGIDFSFTENEVKFKNTSSLNPATKDKEITIPYGTDLTNYNKATFRQSLIDYTSINSPFNTLKETITNNQTYPTTIKTLVDNNIFPKTTNTLITLYYSSYIDNYIPPTTANTNRNLVSYYDAIDATPLFVITVVNSTIGTTPGISLAIITTTGPVFKVYKATKETPKIVCDLTTDLAEGRPGEVIKYAKFGQNLISPYTRSVDDFFQDCTNLLSNIFISYTYDE
jgi:hypothetical protein